MEEYRASRPSVTFGSKKGSLADRFKQSDSRIDPRKSALESELSFHESSDPAFRQSSPNPSLSTNKHDEYMVQVPIMIGDRVVVGRTGLCGTVAYIGPTHFSVRTLAGVALDSPKGRHDGIAFGIRYFRCQANCGIFYPLSKLFRLESRELSPNTRFRVSKQRFDRISQSTGIDSRRFSIRPTCTHVNGVESKLHQGSAISVVGRVSPVRCTHRGTFGSRRAQSLREKVRRPVWLPAGSHDLQCSGIWSGYRRCRSSLRNQGDFLTKHTAFNVWNEPPIAKRVAYGRRIVDISSCSPSGDFPCVSKDVVGLSKAPRPPNKSCAHFKHSSDAPTEMFLPLGARLSQRKFDSLGKTAFCFNEGKPDQSCGPSGDSAVTIQSLCSYMKGAAPDVSNVTNSVKNRSVPRHSPVLDANKLCKEAEEIQPKERECPNTPLNLNDSEMLQGLLKMCTDPLGTQIQPKSGH